MTHPQPAIQPGAVAHASPVPLPPTWPASACLSLAALFWSGNFIVGRLIRDDIDPVSLNLLRWLIALLVFLPFVARPLWRHRHQALAAWPLLCALGLTGVAGFHTAVYLALQDTTAVNALLILSLSPVLVLWWAVATGTVRATPSHWGGCMLCLLGVAVLITRADPLLLRDLDVSRGDLWMLLAMVLWSAYTLLLRQRPAQLPQDVTLAASMLPALVVMTALSLMTDAPGSFELTPRLGAALAYIAVFASVIAFLLWSHGVAALGPARAGQFVHLMPVFGAVLAVTLLGEALVVAQLAGALLVVLGLAWLHRAPAA